jgi:hypothetical protein
MARVAIQGMDAGPASMTETGPGVPHHMPAASPLSSNIAFVI